MTATTDVLFRRRKDGAGFERLVLSIGKDALVAASTVIRLDDGGFRLDHSWRLTRDWRARSVTVDKKSPDGDVRLALERADGGC